MAALWLGKCNFLAMCMIFHGYEYMKLCVCTCVLVWELSEAEARDFNNVPYFRSLFSINPFNSRLTTDELAKTQGGSGRTWVFPLTPSLQQTPL